MPLRGRPLISYPLAAAHAANLETLVVAKPDTPLPSLRCEVVVEPAVPRHPLCGLIAALRRAEGRPVVAIACDMPFLTPSLLRRLADSDGTTVVNVNGRFQPLLGRYEPVVVEAFTHALAREQSLRSAIAAIGSEWLDERLLERFGDPGRLCFNVNTAADLACAERMLGGTTGL